MGIEVGEVGYSVGCPVGRLVGKTLGEPDGLKVGLADVGRKVGLLVSPGLVGRDVTGCTDGIDVGFDEVGDEVGASIIFVATTRVSYVRTAERE